MSQNDFVIANQTAPAFRADLNSALQALASVSSGATEPATKYANMLWYDTGTNTLKKRNEANSAWINMGAFDEGTGTFTPTGTPPVQTQTTWDTGTSTTESVISPAKLKGAIDNSVADLAEGAAGAPRVQGLALSGRMFGPVTGSDPVGFTSLDGVAVVTLNWQGSVYQTHYMQVRFTNNGGSSWGSYQNITALAGYSGKFGGVTTINLLTGDFVTATESPMNLSGTLTVPSGVNGIQIANSSTSATDMAVVLLIEEGVV